MESVNLAMLGSPKTGELAAEIAKKGGETDVTQYNFKQGERSLTIFVPAKYPDKIQGVSYALQAADHVVLVVDELDRHLGEQIVGIDAAGRDKGFILLRNYIQPDQIKPLLAGSTLESYEILDTEDPALLRERFIDLQPTKRDGETRVDVDQHFNVKGVGTVVLGVVVRGSVKKHQELMVHPTSKRCQVRSIQVHDTNIDEATTGSRVGLALKNIDSDDLDRGNVLGPDGTVDVIKGGETLDLDIRVPKFYKAGLKVEQVIHIGTGMQFLPAKIEAIADGEKVAAGTSGKATIKVQNPLCIGQGDSIVLYNLDDANLRVVGGATY